MTLFEGRFLIDERIIMNTTILYLRAAYGRCTRDSWQLRQPIGTPNIPPFRYLHIKFLQVNTFFIEKYVYLINMENTFIISIL